MIKLCGKSIAYPFKLILEASLQEGTVPGCYKNANGVPVHKKEDKNLLKTYKPTCLLPIFGKIFSFSYFYKSQFFTKCQSGFLSVDSCTSQLLSIVHNIKFSFDCDPCTLSKGSS